MKQIDQVLLSDGVWNLKFACDLEQCLGKCCQNGDLGAPLSDEEENTIQRLLPEILPRLPKKNGLFLQAGISEFYHGKKHIREIAPNTPCPLAEVNDKGMVLCSLHAHALEHHLPVEHHKPLWCHLFPLIIIKTPFGWAINAEVLPFCRSRPDAPPILLAFSGVLASVFGQPWMDKVRAEYDRTSASG